VEFIFDETVSSGMLEGIEVLVLPNVSFLCGREWSALCAFMDRGGLVIASGSLGGDERAREVEETFGLRCGPKSRFSVSYLSMPGAGPRGILVRGAYVEYPGTPEGAGAVVEPICETGPREFFHNNLPAPYRRTTVPGLIERAKGGGALALFPQPIFRHYAKEPSRELREVVRSLVGRHAKPPVVELRVPLKMDYSIYRDGDTLYVHLLNPNVEPSICCGLMDTLDGDYERSYEYMEETAPVLDLELLVHGGKCKSVRTLREKFPFSVSAAEQGTEIRIARVDIWEIVRIELAVRESGAWA
jgi:hypothetical protein